MLSALVSVSSLSLSDEEKRWLEKYQPAGVSLFARNIRDADQLRRLTGEIRAAAGRDDILIAVDQEGGRVRRLSGSDFHPAASQYVLGQLDEEMAAAHAEIISNDLRRTGINFNFSPVLDMAYPATHPVLKSRCFGSSEQKTALLGKAMISAYLSNGVCPCIKHMPGHGRAETDPHLGLPVLNNALPELAKDFYPFTENNDCPAGMTAHIVVSAVDDRLPVTLSKKAIDYLIRGLINFNGLLISDAIDMKALNGSVGEKAAAVIAAGCDLVCYCGGKSEDLAMLAENCPQASDRTLERLQTVNEVIARPDKPLDTVLADRYYRAVGLVEEYDETYDATEVLNRMQKGNDAR